MTSKQMYQAMKKWNISLIWDKREKQWIAGTASTIDERTISLNLALINYMTDRVSRGDTMQSAVEDYCNARDLECDR